MNGLDVDVAFGGVGNPDERARKRGNAKRSSNRGAFIQSMLVLTLPLGR